MADKEARFAAKKTTTEIGDDSNDEGKISARPLSLLSNSAHPIGTVLNDYLASLRNISQTVQIVMPHLSKWLIDELRKAEKKLAHFIPPDSVDSGSTNVSLESVRDFVEFVSMMQKIEELKVIRP